ncbi:MAG: Gfo/Idh/MocA family protein, partial [Terriglobales bacterium]
YGYWGPNLVRNFFEHPEVEVRYVCDIAPDRLDRIACKYPSIQVTSDCGLLFNDDDVDIIAIATPASSHFPLAKTALLAGKHVFVEKPMCLRSEDCLELIALAEARKLTLAVDHPFIFHGAVRRIKRELDSFALGDVLYFDSVRINLGLFQNDINVVWDLAPHDLSIIDFLFRQSPISVQAFGKSHSDSGLEDMAYVTLTYESGMVAHLNLSWLSPVKVRQILIGGTNKMIAYDDLQATEKIKIYDKGVAFKPDLTAEARYNSLVQYRMGDTFAPVLDLTEALTVEIDQFVRCIRSGEQPDSDGWCGYRIVSLLEEIDRAMSSGQTRDLRNSATRACLK